MSLSRRPHHTVAHAMSCVFDVDSLRFSYAASPSSTHPPYGCPHDESCLRSRATPQSPMECAVPATHPPYSCPHDETRLNAPTAQFPARWNSPPRTHDTVAHAARALRRTRLTVARAASSLRRTHLAVAHAMRSPSIKSPHGCPHDELDLRLHSPHGFPCDELHPMLSPRGCPRDEPTSGYVLTSQLSCAMSSCFDTPFPAVARETQSSLAITLAAVARATVFAPQRITGWLPKR